jgi:CDGSH-type Zn-finger protein
MEAREKVRHFRCGQSRNKPFCDNSHLDAGFDDPGAIP